MHLRNVISNSNPRLHPDFELIAHLNRVCTHKKYQPYKHIQVVSGYSSSPDLANTATVWVSLIEGSRRKDSQIQEKMVLKRQYLEILRSLIIFWQDRCRPQFNHSWDCRLHIFWLYDHWNIRHRPAILEKLPSLINFWQDCRCPQQGSTVLPLLRFSCHIFRSSQYSSSTVYIFSQSLDVKQTE